MNLSVTLPKWHCRARGMAGAGHGLIGRRLDAASASALLAGRCFAGCGNDVPITPCWGTGTRAGDAAPMR
jgi:hypothetical protein